MIKKVGVVGAGMMGAEIALCFARSGYDTVLCDMTQEIADNGKVKQEAVLDKNIKKGRITEADKEATLAKVSTTADYNDMADCDLIIEAVLEVIEIKEKAFAQLDAICKESTIFASNTSSISISKLASSVKKERKGQFIGTHFNSPASVMKLVEVVPGLLTEEETVTEVIDIMNLRR
jgi:3-hydroxyacyl-CoA dehydrogenase